MSEAQSRDVHERSPQPSRVPDEGTSELTCVLTQSRREARTGENVGRGRGQGWPLLKCGVTQRVAEISTRGRPKAVQSTTYVRRIKALCQGNILPCQSVTPDTFLLAAGARRLAKARFSCVKCVSLQ